MSLAFVFPGQGSQTVGMGRAPSEALPAGRAVMQAAAQALGEPLSRPCFEGPGEELPLTREHAARRACSTSKTPAWLARTLAAPREAPA